MAFDDIKVIVDADTRKHDTKMKKSGNIANKAGDLAKKSFLGAAGAITKTTVAVGTLGGTLSAAGGAAFLKTMYDTTANQQVLADRLGVTANQVRQLQHAFAETHSDIDRVADAMSTMSEKITDAGTAGSGALAPFFKQMGVDAKAFKQLDMPQQILELSDMFSQMSRNDALYWAKEMGDDVYELLPVLRKGSDYIRQMQKEAQTLGSDFAVTSEEMNQMNKSFGRIKTLGFNVTQRIAVEVAKPMADFAEHAAKNFIDYVKSNYEGSFQKFIEDWSSKALRVLASVVSGLTTGINGLIRVGNALMRLPSLSEGASQYDRDKAALKQSNQAIMDKRSLSHLGMSFGSIISAELAAEKAVGDKQIAANTAAFNKKYPHGNPGNTNDVPLLDTRDLVKALTDQSDALSYNTKTVREQKSLVASLFSGGIPATGVGAGTVLKPGISGSTQGAVGTGTVLKPGEVGMPRLQKPVFDEAKIDALNNFIAGNQKVAVTAKEIRAEYQKQREEINATFKSASRTWPEKSRIKLQKKLGIALAANRVKEEAAVQGRVDAVKAQEDAVTAQLEAELQAKLAHDANMLAADRQFLANQLTTRQSYGGTVEQAVAQYQEQELALREHLQNQLISEQEYQTQLAELKQNIQSSTGIGITGGTDSATDPLSMGATGVEGEEVGFFDQLQLKMQETLASSNDFRDSMIANMVAISERGVSTIGDELTKVVTSGEDVGIAFQNIGKAILRDMIGALIKLGVQWAVNQALAMALGTAATAASAAQAAATLTAWAPAATAASIATLGSAAAVGTASATTAIVGSKAMAAGMTGMAHNGIDEVPREGTWLLDRGERVYTNKSSQKIDKMAEQVDKGNGVGGSVTIEMHNTFASDVNAEQIKPVLFELREAVKDATEMALNEQGRALA